jgi:Cas6b C-terminal domain/Cas6b N-terminal domain
MRESIVLELSTKLVEHCVVEHTLDRDLDLNHARWFRGAIGRQIDRPEFHHHRGGRLIYQHPLIRYDARGQQATIAGLAEGAFLLRSIPAMEVLRLGHYQCRVTNRSIALSRAEVGPCPERLTYDFETPYLALNQANYAHWSRSDSSDRHRLLQRVLVGNLLSLAKAIRLHVSERIQAEVDLEPNAWQELKPGVRLLGFHGTFRANFRLPDGWGIGKSSARGFGSFVSRKADHG